MKLLKRFRNRNTTITKYKMIVDNGNGFYSWNGNLYQSDLIRSAIRQKARAVGKSVATHIRVKPDKSKIVNPEIYMAFLLKEPNPLMTSQLLQEKLITQLELNNNAFAYLTRDENGYPTEIYPIIAYSVEAIVNSSGTLFLKFTLKNGKVASFNYQDILHLRKDFNEHDLFGESPTRALKDLMDIVTVTDQGIVKAIKNSNVIRWLLKFNQTLRPEDIQKNTKDFVKNFLDVETSESSGAAAVDAKMDAQQVEPKDYVPNEKQSDATVKRILSFFNTNEKIVQSNYSEDEWISYYESAIEPELMQMSGEYTRKLFTRRERGFGNKIIFESSNLTFASMATKLKLVNYVDRGIMTPNEVRQILNMAPIDGGEIAVRRLDTRPVTETRDNNSN